MTEHIEITLERYNELLFKEERLRVLERMIRETGTYNSADFVSTLKDAIEVNTDEQ